MSSETRVPMMRLPINQDVFLEHVRDRDAVTDATVATEVVSFEQVGNAYVLEGAVVFAGYLTRSETSEHMSAQAFTVNPEDENMVQHVHHRMPFTLRVPTDSQVSGLLNVKSRISGWKLSVVSETWMRVEGELQISGLSGEGGHHFQCGSQLSGDVFFGRSQPFLEHTPADVPIVTESPQNFVESVGWRSEPATEESPVADSEFRSEPPVDHHAGESLEQISAGRIGHNWADTHQTIVDAEQATQEAETTPTVEAVRESATEVTTTNELFVDPSGEPTFLYRQEDPVAEYEFEHQLSAIQLDGLDRQVVEEEDKFVASQSFTDAGFRATSGFTPPLFTLQVAEEGYESSSVVRAEAAPVGKPAPVPAEKTVEAQPAPSLVQKDLWSFVDFNAPDSKCTVRFIIVMEEETIQTVADRCGCVKSELMRVNQLTVEGIAPGTALMVPQTPYSLVFSS